MGHFLPLKQKNSMNTKTIIITFSIVFIVIIGMVFLQRSSSVVTEPNPSLDIFATCIADSGATFYGAFWCSHCNSQKDAFGSSQKLLPYVECSTPDGRGQNASCADAGVTAYPTWEFPDGSRQEGEVALATLAEKTGCELPELF
jgi:hypothetical protein